LIIAQLKISRQFVFSHKIPLKYLGRRPITSAAVLQQALQITVYAGNSAGTYKYPKLFVGS
jgi:hypothetical protein